ncbi:MAG: DUF523 domain-containing protein [Deltaproteobacteria bacterium]|nr:DUF523 domain-containing protein [Deltaproteobacteria bacterium]
MGNSLFPSPLLQNRFPIMISACLVGVHCRYDGGHATCRDLVDFFASAPFVPFCPEQLGGLPTPRPPAIIKSGDGHDILSGQAKIINATGEDVTDAFRKGSEEAYALARLTGSSLAILKSRSPSCGLKTPHCENASGIGIGVTAAFFQSHGIKVFELDSDDPFPCKEFIELLDEVC